MFKYYNANPEGINIGDCVIRAIANALNKPYSEILYQLFEISNYFNCNMIVKDCYNILLNDYYGFKCYNGMGNTVKQVANDFKDKTLIIRIEGHLTMSRNGIIEDTWNCEDKIVDVFWIVD